MTFERYFKASSYWLIASGFIAVASTGSTHLFPLTLFASAFVGSWFIDTVKVRQSIPPWILNCLSLACLLFFAADYRFFSRSFVVSAVHLILFVAAVKLLTVSRDRDYFFLYLISFTELVAASTLTVNIVFGVCFLSFLLSGINTLMLFEMRRSNAEMQRKFRVQPLVIPDALRGTGLELFSPFPSRLLIVMSIGMTLLVLAAALPLFFVLPRIATGLHRHPSGSTHFISGFSERIELGQIGTIKQSDAVVMRIRIAKSPSQLPIDMKWRGLAFDYYDGRSWKRSDRQVNPIPIQGAYYKLENTAQGTNWLNQTFFVEALSTNAVFAARKVLAISRDVGSLTKDTAENLFADRSPVRKIRYTAISDLSRPNPSYVSDREPIPRGVMGKYLQLPPLDSRIADLAERATRAADGRYAKARALERYLLSHFAYSLELRGIPNTKDPLAVFLFDTGAGHCEYFASAMVIMLRYLQIPSRLVNGFRGGEYNSIGDTWVVRQYNAHSWVEAYFPPYGWIEFDPTPPDPRHSRSAFLRVWSNLTDALDLWWWEGVVNYDSAKQFRLISTLNYSMDRFQYRVRDLTRSLYEKARKELAHIDSALFISSLAGKWIYCVLLIIVVSLPFVRPLHRHISKRARNALYKKNRRSFACSFYGEAVAMLAKRGIQRTHEQTPMEFALSLEKLPASAPFLALTRFYNAIRFGPPDAIDCRLEAENLLRSLRTSLKDVPENSRGFR